MDKETMVQIHNGIVPSLKKEGIWASSNEVDAYRAYYTELDKSEKEKQTKKILGFPFHKPHSKDRKDLQQLLGKTLLPSLPHPKPIHFSLSTK